jgi:hypothetical protein
LQGKKISKTLWIKKSAHLTSHISFTIKMKKKRKLKTRTTNTTNTKGGGGGYGRGGVLVVGRFSLRDTRARRQESSSSSKSLCTLSVLRRRHRYLHRL